MTCFTDNCIHLEKHLVAQRKSKIKSIMGSHTVICVTWVKKLSSKCVSIFSLKLGTLNGHHFPGTDQQQSWQISPEWWLRWNVGVNYEAPRERAEPNLDPEMPGEPWPPLTPHKPGFCFPCRQTSGAFLFMISAFGNIFIKQKVLLS